MVVVLVEVIIDMVVIVTIMTVVIVVEIRFLGTIQISVVLFVLGV